MADDAITDYEDLTGMQLTDEELDGLVSPGGECVFNWTNSQGYPVGVVVAYVWRHGKFWTTCAARRARVPALRKRPQSGIIINRGGSANGGSLVASADCRAEPSRPWPGPPWPSSTSKLKLSEPISSPSCW